MRIPENVFRKIGNKIEDLIDLPHDIDEGHYHSIIWSLRFIYRAHLADWQDRIFEHVKNFDRYGLSYFITQPEQIEDLKQELEWLFRKPRLREIFTASLAGTCKVIGADYHKALRMFLEHDYFQVKNALNILAYFYPDLVKSWLEGLTNDQT